MNVAFAKIAGWTAAAVLVVGGIALWRATHRPVNPITDRPQSAQTIGDFDEFQQDLARRVMKQFGSDSDFSVIVATTDYPVGTLLRASGSVPADLNDCIPAAPPKPYTAQHLFPSYKMSSGT